MRRFLVSIALVLTLASCKPDAVDRAMALSAVAAAQADAGETVAARETIALAVEILRDGDEGDDADALLAIAWAQAKAGDIADARITGRGTSRYFESLGHVAIVQARNGDRDGARETIAFALDTLGGDDELPVHLVLAQGLTGDVEEAVANSRRIDIVEGRFLVLSVLAGLQAEAGDLAGMEATLALFQEIPESPDDIDPEMPSFFISVETLVRTTGHDWQGALRAIDRYEAMLREIPEDDEDREPALIVATLFRHLVMAREGLHRGDEEKARQALDQAEQAAANISDKETRDLFKVVVAYFRVLAGGTEVMQEAGKTIEDQDFRYLFLGHATMALAIQGDAAGAEEMIARAASETGDGKETLKEASLMAAAEARLILGDKKGALRALEGVKNSGDALQFEIAVRLLSGEIAEATAMAMDWFAYYDVVASPGTIQVAALQARAGDYAAARRTALGIASEESADALRQRAADLALRLRHPDDATAGVMEISDPALRSNDLIALAGAKAESGDMEEARRLTGMAQEAARTIDSHKDRSSQFIAVAASWLALGNRAEHAAALEYASAASSWIGDASDRARQYLAVAEKQAAAGLTEDARHAARLAGYELPRLRKRAEYEVVADIAVLLAGLGELEKALRIAGDNLPTNQRISAYRKIAARMAESGDTDGARAILARAGDLAQGLSHAHKRAGELSGIARDRADIGDLNDARATVRQARTAARSEPDQNWRAGALAEVGWAFAVAGLDSAANETFLLAVNAATSLPDPAKSARSLFSIALTAENAGLRGWKTEALTRAWSATAKIGDPETRDNIRREIRCARTGGCPAEKRQESAEIVLAGVTANPFQRVREAIASARNLAASGDAAGARAGIGQAAAAAENLNDRLLRAKAWMAVAAASREIGDDTAADRQLDRAAEEAVADDAAWYRARTLIEIAERCEQAGRPAEALRNAMLTVGALRDQPG